MNPNRHLLELIRYVINGLVATAVHFGVLAFNFRILAWAAWVSNLVAAIFGISVSFLGSRYFVFPGTTGGIVAQAARFIGLYGAIASLHGLILLIWTDWLGFDYRAGFLLATAFQVLLSYAGNKFLIFKT
jgi:putative flippase GtrA